MESSSSLELEYFKKDVGIKFQLYNSLFTSLPFHRIEKTGILLSLLLNHCEEGYDKGQSPTFILNDFFDRYTILKDDQGRVDLLFRFIQYMERQVVLFDALEDAAFKEITDVKGVGTLKHLESVVTEQGAQQALFKKLNDFSVRLVLTAHPTQFYPGPVLGIINDLAKALKENNTNRVNLYLQQLGKTPFFKKEKPSPYDEAMNLIWYLENIFYNAGGRILSLLKDRFSNQVSNDHNIISLGFWPGGDRDGNPNVTADTTQKVADALRSSILKCYYLDVRQLKRRLTFKGVDTILQELEMKLYENIFIPDQKTTLTKKEIVQYLQSISEILVKEHNGLFLSLVNNLKYKVEVFGLHFASIDIRQESSVHNKVLEEIAEKEKLLPADYANLSDEEKIFALEKSAGTVDKDLYNDISKDTILSILLIPVIQKYNGERGCNRYIISQSHSALNVLEVYHLFLLNGWNKTSLNIDIVPLFETIDDLRLATSVMHQLYSNNIYKEHLERRNKTQTIMVGFSDGTKDGGYLMANWSIFKAKKELTAISEKQGISVIFFDGRGGPPARGGGKTHKFYASMGSNISTKEIQLTIQGQTVSSTFGNIDGAQFNIEQLLHAGITNDLFPRTNNLRAEDEQLIDELAAISYDTYNEFKKHPQFLNFLINVSPLNYYGETNIGSRPTKRGKQKGLDLKDLRAIPFVGAWSQLKLNVPGFYGVGTAMEVIDKNGKLSAVKNLYRHSLFFKTLLDNCEMAMKKTFFPLTEYLKNHPQYEGIWNLIFKEFELTKKYLLLVSGKEELMEDYPVEKLSIQMRERIVLPLTTIQQYALAELRNGEEGILTDAFKKLVVRSSFGIVNAGRNSI
ncbi:MAG: phosphoenolpyruvate carboxylase [Bacteroidota bacterium]|nr:phosphoenolpyruvate carboxylase [Bacteroidota bacterium]